MPPKAIAEQEYLDNMYRTKALTFVQWAQYTCWLWGFIHYALDNGIIVRAYNCPCWCDNVTELKTIIGI